MKKLLLLLGFFITACAQQMIVPENHLAVLAVGDSITYGETNASKCTPNDFAIKALDTTASLMKLGFRGENARDFLLTHKQQFLDSLARVPNPEKAVTVVWFGHNDLNVYPKEVALENILHVAQWAHDTAHVGRVLILPIFNRTDKWGFTRATDGTITHRFNEERLWLNAQLHSRAAAWPWARVGNESDSPAMYSETYPADKQRCADEVHPKDFGAEEVGRGTIARAIASFGDVRLK